TTLTTFNLDVGAAYELDLFGRVRSLKKEALEKYFASDEARKSVQIALVSEVATEYLTQLRLLKAKAIANQTLEAVQESYNLIKRRFQVGAASELELRTAEGQVQTVRVNSANFLQLLAESENALVLLIGQPLPDDLPSGNPFHSRRNTHGAGTVAERPAKTLRPYECSLSTGRGQLRGRSPRAEGSVCCTTGPFAVPGRSADQRDHPLPLARRRLEVVTSF